jgi:hypothetical protein
MEEIYWRQMCEMLNYNPNATNQIAEATRTGYQSGLDTAFILVFLAFFSTFVSIIIEIAVANEWVTKKKDVVNMARLQTGLLYVTFVFVTTLLIVQIIFV